jgi:hypothetical protein
VFNILPRFRGNCKNLFRAEVTEKGGKLVGCLSAQVYLFVQRFGRFLIFDCKPDQFGFSFYAMLITCGNYWGIKMSNLDNWWVSGYFIY